jgi:voltage-gated potassium channel
MDEDGVLYIVGEATDENSLIKAGIERAKAVVAALATDTDNVRFYKSRDLLL